MFDHVTIRVSDPEASERFYETVLASIGIDRTGSGGDFGDGCPEFGEWDDFSLAPGDTPTTGLHVGFCAWSREDVDRFWQAGVDAGYESDGEPGMRTQYRDDYYGAFLLDPDGNSIEAVHHGDARRNGVINHLWIRVADLGASKRFYETIAAYAGFQLREEVPDRVRFGVATASF